MELIHTKILELELELNPKTVAGIGIGINSIFFGMTKGLDSDKFQELGKEESLEEKFQKILVKPLQPLLCLKAKYSLKMKQLCFNLRGRIICLKILVRTNNFQVT